MAQSHNGKNKPIYLYDWQTVWLELLDSRRLVRGIFQKAVSVHPAGIA